MARSRSEWRCSECGASAIKWMGRCNDCGSYGTFVEVASAASATSRSLSPTVPIPDVVSLGEAGGDDADRVAVGIRELDQVLGGGFVEGSLTLLGGEPGIGKSTILLQAADAVAKSGRSVLYACGEESVRQVGLRAKRLGATSDRVGLLPEIEIARIEAAVAERKPDVLIVDSIQTAVDSDIPGAQGSVSQVRACTSRLVRVAKELGVTTIIVGHVTKDGSLAGPRVLEHMVDTVLYFEGDRDHAFRIIRAVKNRFGSTSEIGIFEMTERGLAGVDSPSAMLLGERTEPAAGSIVMAAMEGSRPLLVEVQALVTRSYLPSPKRFATGIEVARLNQVLGVLERRAGLSFADKDVYASVTGGIRVVEPAIDLPLALALASALRDRALPLSLSAFGEIGLTGRIRVAPHAPARVAESHSQGIDRTIAAWKGAAPQGVTAVTSIRDAVEAVGLTF